MHGQQNIKRNPRYIDRITSVSKMQSNITYIYIADRCCYIACLNNYMFQPLYQPSSGWPLSYYKVNYKIYIYLLTPWCRVLLEKLTGFQLVKKFPAFLWNPKVLYRTHKRPPTLPILGQPNPVHIPTSHLLEIHPNIIHTSTPKSPQWSLSLRFPHQDPIRPPLLTHTRHMPSPSHSSRFYHPQNFLYLLNEILPKRVYTNG